MAKLFDVSGRTGEIFPDVCPICGKRDAHIFMHRFSEYVGEKWAAYVENRGGKWVWCGNCHSFCHMSGEISAWWHNLVTVDEGKLTVEPDYLNEKSAELDQWVNGVIADVISRGGNLGDESCEKCGGVMRPIRESAAAGKTCYKCGWGWVTSCLDPLISDSTVYNLKIRNIEAPTIDELRVLSSVMDGNYLNIKKQIEQGSVAISGNARETKVTAELLRRKGIAFEISPAFPHSFKNSVLTEGVQLIREFSGFAVGTRGRIVDGQGLLLPTVELLSENGDVLTALSVPASALETVKTYS